MVVMETKVEGLWVSYDGVEVLKDLNFACTESGIVAIVGPNGSGKTTLLRTLNRKLAPDKGKVFIDGRNLSAFSRKEIARKIAVVPQMSAVRFPFTVADAVLMGRLPHIEGLAGEKKGDFEAARNAMAATGTEHLATRPITEISGGEYQRVIIARALAQEPSVLLLDEPTLHLDLNHQLVLLDLLEALVRDRGLTVLMTTHDINLALRYPDRVMLLDSGSILADGNPTGVLTAENIRRVYGVEVEFQQSTDSGITSITPLSPTGRGKEESNGSLEIKGNES